MRLTVGHRANHVNLAPEVPVGDGIGDQHVTDEFAWVQQFPRRVVVW